MTMRKTAEENRIAREVKKIEAEKNQKPVKEIVISIEWVKSRTWGHNPNATAEVHFQDGTFSRKEGYRASGCGYDKESTVVAAIFDDFLKYKLWERDLTDAAPYGISSGNTGSYEYRYFGGGIGMSCYPRIAEFIGGKMENVASGKTFDVWKYTDL